MRDGFESDPRRPSGESRSRLACPVAGYRLGSLLLCTARVAETVGCGRAGSGCRRARPAWALGDRATVLWFFCRRGVPGSVRRQPNSSSRPRQRGRLSCCGAVRTTAWRDSDPRADWPAVGRRRATFFALTSGHGLFLAPGAKACAARLWAVANAPGGGLVVRRVWDMFSHRLWGGGEGAGPRWFAGLGPGGPWFRRGGGFRWNAGQKKSPARFFPALFVYLV